MYDTACYEWKGCEDSSRSLLSFFAAQVKIDFKQCHGRHLLRLEVIYFFKGFGHEIGARIWKLAHLPTFFSQRSYCLTFAGG